MKADAILYLGSDHPRSLMYDRVFGTINIYSFKVIVLETDGWLSELLSKSKDSILPYGTATWVSQRFSKLIEWVQEGHVLIILVRTLPFFREGSRGEIVPASKFAPFSLVRFSQASGYSVQACSVGASNEVLKRWVSKIQYTHVLSKKALAPLIEATRANPGPQQCVGGYLSLGNGQIFFMPPLNSSESDHDREQYIIDIASLHEIIERKAEEFPEWASDFLTSEELRSRAKIGEISATIARLKAQLEVSETDLKRASLVKHLVTGSGEDFKDAVADALRELGLAVVEGPHPRADLLATDGSRLLVIEAKGFDGSVSEKPLAQLNRWVPEVQAAINQPEEDRAADPDLKRYAEALAELGVLGKVAAESCKPMMIIATYRKVRFDQRTAPDFPDQVRRNVDRSNVCAMTGFQLLCLLLRCREDESQKPHAIESLFATNGVYDMPTSDWASVFTHKPAGDDSEPNEDASA